MNITTKINQFYKLAQPSNLSSFLQNALQDGEKEYYYVFLDLLEETDPQKAKELKKQSTLSDIFGELIGLCPSVISMDLDVGFTFSKPILGGIKSIDFYYGNIFSIVYESMTAEMPNGKLSCLVFKENKPAINQYEVNQIMNLSNKYHVSINRNSNINTDNFAPIHNSLKFQEAARTIFLAQEQRILLDIFKLKQLFL